MQMHSLCDVYAKEKAVSDYTACISAGFYM